MGQHRHIRLSGSWPKEVEVLPTLEDMAIMYRMRSTHHMTYKVADTKDAQLMNLKELLKEY